MTVSMASVVIFVIVLILMVIRPRGISEAWPAMIGGILMIAIGRVTPAVAFDALAENLSLFGFFLGLMVIAAIAEQAGFFAWTARMAVIRSGGSPTRLLVNIFIVGTVITAVLTNDATALVLTPVVYVLVTRLRLTAAPYVFACSFVADAASFLLPVSNPVNLILLGPNETRLAPFLWHLLIPSFLVLLWNIAFFRWFFRADLTGTVSVHDLPLDAHDPRFLRTVSILLASIGVGYIAATSAGLPVAIVALGGSAALIAAAIVHGHWRPRETLRAISWPLFPFVGGMVLLVHGVESVTSGLAQWLFTLAEGSTATGVFVTTFGVAIGANIVNNVPIALIAAAALNTMSATASDRLAIHYAAVLGADLGPNISVMGSLATMLWLLMLRRRGLTISSLDYLRFGVLVTPPALLIGAIALWLSAISWTG